MLGLRHDTDLAWAQHAVSHSDELLVDHAHCELKAATNAMSLVVRYPANPALVEAMTALAAEELEHFQRVHQVLVRRGVSLGFPPANPYAAALRTAAGALPSRHKEAFVLVDRLLIGALIEARSCERFKLVANELACRDMTTEQAELHAFYEELFACEARHYRTYIDLAKMAAGEHADEVDARFDVLAEAEADIVRMLRGSPRPECAVHG